MKPVLLLFGTLAALLMPGGALSVQGPTDWKQAPYFDAPNSELRPRRPRPAGMPSARGRAAPPMC